MTTAGLAVLVLILPLLGHSAQDAHAAPLEKVTLQLRWFHQFQFAGYYAAKAKGFYEEAGLDVTIVERDLKVSPINAVLDGKADFGVTNSEVLYHRLSGKPLVALAAIFQHSPLVLVVHKGNNISSPHDLVGRRVLMSTKSMDVELLGMLQSENISLDQVDIIDRFSQKGDYFDQNIDALAAYLTNQPYYLKSRGIPYSVLYPSTYGIDFYGDCLFTTEEQIREHPDRVRAFRKASLKGWQYAMDHPQEIVDLIIEEYKTKKTRDHLVFEAEAIRTIMLPELVEIGHMNAGRWRHIADVFEDLGIIDSNIPMDSFIYDPTVRPDDSPFDYFFYSLGLVALALAIGALALFVFNLRLQSQVHRRTEALSIKAAELEKANLRLTELDHVKSALLSSVSHELRTPLTSVLGFVKLIGKEFNKSFAPLADGDPTLERKTERIDKNLRVIEVEGERLARLISDVLDLSRIESGKVIWRDRDIELTELCRNAGAIVQEQFAQNPNTLLIIEVQDRLPTLHADPDRIIQVLINLLTNAAKFTEEGEVQLTVFSAGDGWVHMVVSDTGIGVAKEDVEQVFNMFHQVRRGDTLRLNTHGAGLGLAISKDIVEHYGGTIHLESELGKGSRFTVSLPVIRPEAE